MLALASLFCKDPKLRVRAARKLDSQVEAEWGELYPRIVKFWRDNWERVGPFIDFPPAVRKVIYTTNAIESLNASLRKAVTPRRHFPTDGAAKKVLYLAIRNATKRWSRPQRRWSEVIQYLSLYFEGRIPTN